MLILDGSLPADQWPVPGNTYEEQATAFGRSWQSGQAEFVLHTSGSTGTPKPITLTRAQMKASAELTGRTFGLIAGDTALCCLNVAYVAGTMMLVRAMTLGLKLTVVEPSGNPLAGFDTETAHFDFMAFVPLQLQAILAQTPEKTVILNRAKAILLGGAATSPTQETQLQTISAPVYATYGMTETVSHVAIRRLNGSDASDYFTALSGVESGVDERGCLTIRAAASQFELIQTNDIIEWADTELPHSQFRIVGRADSIINTGGVKVQPERVERVIRAVLALAGLTPRLFVTSLPDEQLGQQVVLVVEGDLALRQAVEATKEQWAALVRREIGPYAVPKGLIFTPTFYETPTGKIDRNRTLDTTQISMFKNAQIRFQTARSLPAPYAYFFTLTAQPAFTDSLAVDLSITYPDREDIDEDELIAEGYTRNDDFVWNGRLGQIWQQAVETLVRNTTLELLNEDDLDEDDDFWEVTLTTEDGTQTAGMPKNYEAWQYLIQELMQATYEASERERPFDLTYLEPKRDGGEYEVHLTASFVERTVKIETIQHRRSTLKTLPWKQLQPIMNTIYGLDFEPEEAEQKRPRHDGAWLNLGTDEWHNVGQHEAIVDLFRGMA